LRSQPSYPQAILISSFWVFTSHSYTMESGAPQGWILGSLILNVFITYICDSICKYRCLLFSVNSKIFHDIRNVEKSKLLQIDIHSLQKWCLVNDMKLIVGQTTCITFIRKTSINILKPNDIYICRTAALTSRRYILNIYSTNIHTEYFKHAA